MFNLIKMNFIRIFKMKCVYIMMIVCVGLSSLSMIGAVEAKKEANQQKVEEQQTTEDDSVSISLGSEVESSTILEEVMAHQVAGFLMIMIGIFVTILTCSERDSGFLKNLVSCSQNKGTIFVAKLVTAIPFLILLEIAIFVSLFIMNMIFGSPMQVGSFEQFLPAFGIQMLLHVAFAALILLLSEITRSLLAGIIISILTGFGLFSYLLSLISPSAVQYMLFSRIRGSGIPIDAASLPTTLIIGVLALVVYTIVGCLITQKRDTY